MLPKTWKELIFEILLRSDPTCCTPSVKVQSGDLAELSIFPIVFIGGTSSSAGQISHGTRKISNHNKNVLRSNAIMPAHYFCCKNRVAHYIMGAAKLFSKCIIDKDLYLLSENTNLHLFWTRIRPLKATLWAYSVNLRRYAPETVPNWCCYGHLQYQCHVWVLCTTLYSQLNQSLPKMLKNAGAATPKEHNAWEATLVEPNRFYWVLDLPIVPRSLERGDIY